MILSWAEHAWEDYLFWQLSDKKTLKRINALLKDMMRHPDEGIGEPEPLRYHWSGYYSRRIDKEHRIVYKIADNTLYIAQCRFHY
jgi:toxin YoeB